MTLRKELCGAQAEVFTGRLYICVLLYLDFHLMISFSEHLEFGKLAKIPFHSESGPFPSLISHIAVFPPEGICKELDNALISVHFNDAVSFCSQRT